MVNCSIFLQNYPSSAEMFSYSEGDCELSEFDGSSAAGGIAVSSKTARQQCEDHCLFYVSYRCHKHINHLVRNTPNCNFTVQNRKPCGHGSLSGFSRFS